MKKIFLIPIILTAFMCLTLPAQFREPPKPIDNKLFKWFEGEWEGEYTGFMGKTKEVMKCNIKLNGQFLIIQSRQTAKGMDYKSFGAITIDLKTGEYLGLAMDNYRSRYRAKGKQEGMKVTLTWTGTGNQSSTVRSFEKAGENKMKSIMKATGYNGEPVTFHITLTRKTKK